VIEAACAKGGDGLAETVERYFAAGNYYDEIKLVVGSCGGRGVR